MPLRGVLKRVSRDGVRYYGKRSRYEGEGTGQQVVPSLEEGTHSGSNVNASGSSAGGVSAASRTQSPTEESGRCPTWLGSSEDDDGGVNFVIPKPGTPVDRKTVKRVGGKYLLGPKIGHGPVECINQYLARLENTDQFFHLKILVLDAEPQNKKTAESEKQAKLLLHSEYQLLKMLEHEEGIIRAYDLFMDSAFEEEPATPDKPSAYVYTGRVKRRIVLAVDCLAPHDFDDKSNAYINLQQYVIREKNLSEMKTLLVFYDIIKIVEKLHRKNIVHRDLKLRNIILNTTTNSVVLTNFCLGKQLLNEDDYLHDQRGSPAYISPDVLSASHQKPYKGKPSDIWALGVVLYTMLYSQFPFFETKPAALFKRIKSVDYKIPKHTKVSAGTQFLIKHMLLLNPNERLTATEIREQIERMISDKRQFFLRIDQMVPEIDVVSHAKGVAAAEGASATRNAATTAVQEPVFDLSRERFAMENELPSPGLAEGGGGSGGSAFPEGVFYFPKRAPARMSVQHVNHDARLLTGDEWGQFSRIIWEHGGTVPPASASTAAAAATAASAPAVAAAPAVAGTPASGGSSSMASRNAARMRVRQMYRYPSGGSTRSPRTEAASNSPIAPAPMRTSDPAIASAVAAVRAQNAARNAAPPQVRNVDDRLIQGIYPRPTRMARPFPASAVATANQALVSATGTVSPSSLLTIRLRPQSSENLNQMLARIDRILTNRLDEAARDFCSTLGEMYSRGRIPSRSEGEQNEFNGVLTTELAEQIGDWLLQDCAETVIVRDIFSESTVNAKEKVVELLRRCGVQVDIGPTIEIKRAQNFDSILVLSYILQAAGYSCSYFA